MNFHFPTPQATAIVTVDVGESLLLATERTASKTKEAKSGDFSPACKILS